MYNVQCTWRACWLMMISLIEDTVARHTQRKAEGYKEMHTYSHMQKKRKKWWHKKSEVCRFWSFFFHPPWNYIYYMCVSIHVGPSINEFTIMMYGIVFLLRFVISFATIIAFEYNLKFKRYTFCLSLSLSLSFFFRLTDFVLFYFSSFFKWNFSLEMFEKYFLMVFSCFGHWKPVLNKLTSSNLDGMLPISLRIDRANQNQFSKNAMS